jgi:hypothetical protein
MNYNKIYQDLINRARTRSDPQLFERHHIVPRCMDGTDQEENLVKLTPEEHYVAHQLLVKMYPEKASLARAVQMMIPNRPNNKMYGWLRRKFIDAQKTLTGKKNSQYGTRWICNLDLKENRKILKDKEIPVGWEIGRNRWKLLPKKQKPKSKRRISAEIRNSITEVPVTARGYRKKASDKEIAEALKENNFNVTFAMASLGYKGGDNATKRFNRILRVIAQPD